MVPPLSRGLWRPIQLCGAARGKGRGRALRQGSSAHLSWMTFLLRCEIHTVEVTNFKHKQDLLVFPRGKKTTFLHLFIKNPLIEDFYFLGTVWSAVCLQILSETVPPLSVGIFLLGPCSGVRCGCLCGHSVVVTGGFRWEIVHVYSLWICSEFARNTCISGW